MSFGERMKDWTSQKGSETIQHFSEQAPSFMNESEANVFAYFAIAFFVIAIFFFLKDS